MSEDREHQQQTPRPYISISDRLEREARQTPLENYRDYLGEYLALLEEIKEAEAAGKHPGSQYMRKVHMARIGVEKAAVKLEEYFGFPVLGGIRRVKSVLEKK